MKSLEQACDSGAESASRDLVAGRGEESGANVGIAEAVDEELAPGNGPNQLEVFVGQGIQCAGSSTLTHYRSAELAQICEGGGGILYGTQRL